MKQTRVRVLLCVLAALSLGVAVAEADEASLTRYAETVDFDPSGGATVTVRCSVTGLAAGDSIAVPYAHAAWPDSFALGDAVREMLVRTIHDRKQLFLTVARDVADGDTLEYRFFLPHASPFGRETTEDFGVRTIAYRVVQPFPQGLRRMTVCVMLPEGVVVNRIVSTTPARKGNSPVSPYAIDMLGKRHCVTVTDSTVEQGDMLALTFEAKPEAKSPLILVALALCAGTYLVLFRNLLKSENGNHKSQ